MTLQHVDTVIAFAVIMLGASLLIMILTQTISTLLNLRGHNLRRSLRDLLQTLCPAQSARAETVTRQILVHPLLSDSRFGSNDDHERYRRPLAIAIGGVCGLLGTAFVDTLAQKLGVFAAAGMAVGLGLSYLGKNWELASALRLEELVRVLGLVDQSSAQALV